MKIIRTGYSESVNQVSDTLRLHSSAPDRGVHSLCRRIKDRVSGENTQGVDRRSFYMEKGTEMRCPVLYLRSQNVDIMPGVFIGTGLKASRLLLLENLKWI